MKRKSGIWIAVLAAAVMMVNIAGAQSLNLTEQTSFKDHNFLIVEQRFNNAPSESLTPATRDEPLTIIEENQTVAITLAEWGDDSRYGVIIKLSNGSYGELLPLERGWGTAVDEKTFGNIKIQVGLMEIFRGRNIEFVRLGVFITKNQ